jgi:4-hydroxybenzoate polyprenyltransferase
MRPPHWLPWLGPVVAAGVGALAGRYWLGGGFWTVLVAALVAGFAVTIGYRVWKRLHHRQ